MRFVAGSPLSDDELDEISQTMVDSYGEHARDVVNQLINEADMLGDFAEHAACVNISLGVAERLRPGLHKGS